jgi:hypothetical protein
MGFMVPTAAIVKKLEGFDRFLQSGVLPTSAAADGLCEILYGFRTGKWRQRAS